MNVTEEPVELTSGLQDVTVAKLHDVAEFRLKVSKADCKVTWLCGATPITESAKYVTGMDGLEPYLRVNDVIGDDEGPFSVKVDDLTSTAKLSVKGKNMHGLINVMLMHTHWSVSKSYFMFLKFVIWLVGGCNAKYEYSFY